MILIDEEITYQLWGTVPAGQTDRDQRWLVRRGDGQGTHSSAILDQVDPAVRVVEIEEPTPNTRLPYGRDGRERAEAVIENAFSRRDQHRTLHRQKGKTRRPMPHISTLVEEGRK